MSEQQHSSIIIYNTIDGKASVSLLAKGDDIWMSQMQLAELFTTSKQNISLHIKNILKEEELHENSVVKDYLTTANDKKNYLVVYVGKNKKIKLNVIIKDETLWTTQKQTTELFGVNVSAINKHIKNILLKSELNNSTISKMEIVQTEDIRKTKYE